MTTEAVTRADLVTVCTANVARSPLLHVRLQWEADRRLGSGVVQVVVDGVTVELQLQSRTEWVPDLERPAEGGVPTVSGVVVRSVGAPLYPC